MVRYNAYGTKGNILAIAFAICSLLAVALRFIARSRTKALYAADDWLALSSLLSFYVWIAVFLWAEQNGSGYRFTALPPPVLIQYLKVAYISTITSILPITLAKLSVLYLYHRLFGQNRTLHLVILVVGFMCIIWFIATTVTVAFQCIPIRKIWHPLLPGHCFKLQNFMVGVEIPNSLLDFVIVGLPVNVIRKLQLPSQQKIALGFIFLLGGFVGVIGIIRIAIVYNPHEIPLHRLGHWMCIQLGFAIICASLPTYRPLLPKATFSSTEIKEWFSSLRSRLGKPSKSSTYLSSETVNSGSAKNARHNHYFNMNDENDNMFLTSAVGGHDQRGVEHDLPENFIVVRKDVEISA